MKFQIALLLFVLGCTATVNGQRVESERVSEPQISEPSKATLCELISKPEAFDGKLVEVRAVLVVWFESSLLIEPDCRKNDGPSDRIWLQFGETEPKDGRMRIVLNEDREYEKLWRLLNAKSRRTKRKQYCVDCRRYTVTATVIGRFDHVTAGKGPTHFGNGAWQSQLVLQSVSEVSARPWDDDVILGPRAK